MQNDKAQISDAAKSLVEQNGGLADSTNASGVYKIECRDKEGNLKWEAESKNLVVNGGLQDMNTKYFTGSSYTATWYLGVYGSGATNNPSPTDTMSSHSGWSEIVTYSNATRPACVFDVPTNANPSVATNATSPAIYNINGSATIGGAFLTTSNTKGGTTGILYSAADFASPGDRNVVNGDTLSVTYSLSLSG